ncbi:hypothetical protein M7I_4169 [Glarea lozoyensis 74030]|uniref:Xylanolytic transcriptional activator regulatory domain-containing protein n=1 Tax=Glarea lozoyensis (strain ATCC 74030 / MF5533) TaxID=1104152 RepID=H0ENG5_GLAL7|nr:hypothetical protein M7I_4169 [Glarea lozoyensis 74030]
MAAIGTQYHHTPEARIRGTEMNELCRRGIDQCPNWDLEVMQAILLTEIFSRFRGRKTTVKLSRRFEDLCHRLLTRTDPTFQAPVCTSPVDVSSVKDLRDRFGLSESTRPLEQARPANGWSHWVQTESKQRLLSACFMFDVHQALYHQQPRSRALKGETQPFLSLPCLDTLWDASTTTQQLQCSIPSMTMDLLKILLRVLPFLSHF